MTFDYQYYASIALHIDRFLLGFSILLAMITLLYVITIEYSWHRRNRALLRIKAAVREIFLLGRDVSANSKSVHLAETASLRQFLDIITNRSRDVVVFDEKEQEVFIRHFISARKISLLKLWAGMAIPKWRRIEAIMVLGYAKISDASDIIEKAMMGKDKDVSYFSMLSLGQMKDRRSAKPLIKYLKVNPSRANKIASILETFPDFVADDASSLLKDEDPVVREWALRLMSNFRARSSVYIKTIEDMTHDKADEVRAAACECIGKISGKDSAGVLIERLKDDSWLVRSSGIKGLADLLRGESVPLIINMASDPSLFVINTLKNVFSIHAEAAMAYIEDYILKGDIVARRVSTEIIERTGKLFGIFKMILEGDDPAKERAIRLLKGMIESKARLNLEEVFSKYTEVSRVKILNTIMAVDIHLAEYIDGRFKSGRG